MSEIELLPADADPAPAPVICPGITVTPGARAASRSPMFDTGAVRASSDDIHGRDRVAHLPARLLAGGGDDELVEGERGEDEAEVGRHHLVCPDRRDLVERRVSQRHDPDRCVPRGYIDDPVTALRVGLHGQGRADDLDPGPDQRLPVCLVCHSSGHRPDLGRGGERRNDERQAREPKGTKGTVFISCPRG